MFEHILILINVEKENAAAIERALKFCQPGHTQVTLLSLVHCRALDYDYLFDKEGRHKARQAYTQHCCHQIKPYADALQQHHIEVNIEVEWSKHRHQDLGAYLESTHFDLIIKTLREHSMLERVLLSHNEWHLTRICRTPLLLVNPNVTYTESPILTIAIDPVHSHDKPAELDHKLMRIGRQLSEHLNGSIAVMHSYDPVPPNLLTDVDNINYQNLSSSITEKHQEAFNNFTSQYDVDDEKQWLLEQDIYEALPYCLKTHNSPLVIMGAISRSRMDQWLIGSTAERLLEVTGTDMLILKPSAPD